MDRPAYLAECATCGRAVSSPFRVYDSRGKVTLGCVAPDHEGHLIPATESARWHNRAEAHTIRRELLRMLQGV
jgi:hypothetical protein